MRWDTAQLQRPGLLRLDSTRIMTKDILGDDINLFMRCIQCYRFCQLHYSPFHPDSILCNLTIMI